MLTDWKRGDQPDKTFKEYLVTVSQNNGYSTQTAWYNVDATDPWWEADNQGMKPLTKQIVAWAELPEPYEG